MSVLHTSGGIPHLEVISTYENNGLNIDCNIEINIDIGFRLSYIEQKLQSYTTELAKKMQADEQNAIDNCNKT